MALYEESKTIVCPSSSLYPNRREGTAMSRHIDKEALVTAVMSSTELDNEQKSQLIRLIREQKKYGLVWENSTEDAWEKMKTSIPVLNEVDDKRILNDKDGEHYPNHAIIEADNLHALIALAYTHAGMIDVIYIDPPYNTGNKDFVYNDSFIGEDDAYRHSKWLSFMEKRLQIAKTLLSEKGVIFISIDDNEQANLKLLCDEVFGSQNFVSIFIWKSRQNKDNRNVTGVSIDHEYILCYSKESGNRIFKGSERKTEQYSNPDNDPRGPWASANMAGLLDTEQRPNCHYDLINPETGINYGRPKMGWRYDRNTMRKLIEDKRIIWPESPSGRPRKKSFLSEISVVLPGFSSVVGNEIYTRNGTKLLDKIFEKRPFDFPKPVELIKELLAQGTKEYSIILDFFAGSGTTLHATMQLAEDGGHRQCILVTNNENNICEEVTYERNKRVIEGYTTPKGEQVAGLSHNNLRYYKQDFNPRKQSHQDNRELFYGLKDLLCIKENIYQEQQQFGSLSLVGKEQMLRYFAENGREMLMVYDTRVIPFIVNEIAQRGEQEQPLKIYIFADGAYPYTDDFASVVDKVSLVPMPYAYYRGIKDSLPEETTTKVDDTELTDEEQQTMMAEAIAFESKE